MTCLMTALNISNTEELSYEDFVRMIIPWEKKVFTFGEDDGEETLEMDVEYALTWMFARELEMHWKLEQIKSNELLDRCKVDFGELYFEIIPANSSQEFITDKNFKSFLSKWCKLTFIEEDICAIMWWMNWTNTNPVSVSISEYTKSILPLHLDRS